MAHEHDHHPHARHEVPQDTHAGHDGHAGHDTHAGHDKHAGHSVEMFRSRFWISFVLTLPTLVWGHMLQRAFGYHAPMFPGSTWIPALFAS